MYVRLSIFTSVFALNFVVSLMERDGRSKKSHHQTDPENMPSASETSIFTAVFRDNRQSYPFSLWCGRNFVAAFLFIKLDFCKSSKSSPVVLRVL